MSFLNYNLESIVDVTDANATVDATANVDVSATGYDAAFYFSGNFLEGNFIQESTDVTTIRSNFLIDQGRFNSSLAWLIDASDITGTSDRTAYGNAAASQKALRIINTTLPYVNIAGTNTGTSSYVHVAEYSKDMIPMLNQETSALPSGADGLNVGETSIGDALLNAVSQSLFKRMGKNAAINNDVTLKSQLQNKFYHALSGEVNEVSNTYSASTFFKRYLDSGRYVDHTSQNYDEMKAYTLNDTTIQAIVKISGNVLDGDGPNLQVSANSQRVFGVPSAIQGANADTQVTDGQYETHIYVTLRQDDRL